MSKILEEGGSMNEKCYEKSPKCQTFQTELFKLVWQVLNRIEQLE